MKKRLLAVLLGALVFLCGCKQNPTQAQLFAPLEKHFSGHGFACSWSDEVAGDVPIYNASVWRTLVLDGESVLVYFDESNRADYQADGISDEKYTFVGTFGLRFVLVYEGTNEQVLHALHAME